MDSAAPSAIRRIERPQAAPVWRRRATQSLGTLVEVSARCASDADFERIVAGSFERLRHYQRHMSFHETGSDLRAIARTAPGDRLRIAPETWAVLATSLALEAETGGLFNVAIAPVLVQRGLLPAPEQYARNECAGSARAALQLLPDNQVMIRQRVWIDLGGIAKGAAVDAALAAAREAGADAVVVNAGGDLAVFGDQDHAIEIVGPGRQRVPAGWLGDGALASSGPFDVDGASMLVAERAVWADRAVSVVAPSCLMADALTKVVAVLGDAAAPLLARHGAKGFSVDARGRLHAVGAAP